MIESDRNSGATVTVKEKASPQSTTPSVKAFRPFGADYLGYVISPHAPM